MKDYYEFTGETLNWDGHILHRIRYLYDGKLGGWIESYRNLSGGAYVDDEAKVYGDAKVCSWAHIKGNAQVYDSAEISHCAKVDGNAKVYNNAKVYDGAQVCGNAQVYGHATVHGSQNCCIRQNAKIYGNAEIEESEVNDNAQIYDEARVYCAYIYNNAKVYGDARVEDVAKIYDDAEVYGEAKVYDWAEVYGNAKVFDRAQVSEFKTEVYDQAQVCGDAKICDKAQICGNMIVKGGKYADGEFSCDEDVSKKIVQDFIYKVDDSNKLTTQTEYDSIDEFFSEPITNDIKLDTLIICAIDTKEPLIKLQKVKTEDKTEFKFIVDIINEDGDNFMFKSVIKSQDQLNRLIQQTVEALKNYSKFSKYADDLEDYLQ